MNKHTIMIGAAVGLIVAAIALVRDNTAEAQVPMQPDAVDIAAGAALYADNCAACHGADLEGQPDWRSPGSDGRLPAPPHDDKGHTWHHGDALIFAYTQLGGAAALAAQGVEFDSGMPGFSDALTEAEIWDIVGFIKSTWPDRVQQMQATRTEAEQLRGN